MRLSEAIRLGAAMHPQAYYSIGYVPDKPTTETCAIGSAFAAVSAVWSRCSHRQNFGMLSRAGYIVARPCRECKDATNNVFLQFDGSLVLDAHRRMITPPHVNYLPIPEEWHWAFQETDVDKFCPCPACSRIATPDLSEAQRLLRFPAQKPADVIAHLNDKHRWTREQIADWVELIEPQPQPQPVEDEKEMVWTSSQPE